MSIKFGPLLGSGLYEQGAGGGGSYTNEQAQDAVGGILTDSTSVDFTYDDGANTITASVITGTTTADIGTAAGGSAATPSKSDHVHGTPMTTTGDIMHYSGGTVARLALGTNGQVLRSNGSALSYSYPLIVPGVYRSFFEDFLGNAASSPHSLSWTTTISGTGAAAVRVVTEAGTFGVLGLDAGTTTTGRAAVSLGFVDFFCGVGQIDFYYKVKFPTLADGTESYQCQWGMGDNAGSGDQTDGIYFQYDNTSGFLVIKSSNNSTRTTTTTSFTMDTNWNIYRISSNAAGTSVDFYVNGTNYGTIATNLPATGARSCGPLVKMEKTAGTTSRLLDIDYFYYSGEF